MTELLHVPQRFAATVPVSELTPHPRNARRGDVGAVHESIKHNRFFGAVLAQEGTGLIIAGEHRWRAAQEAGLTTVPVLYLDVSAEEATRILLADNRTSDLATWANDLVLQLLNGFRETPKGIAGTGFTDEEYDAIVRDLNESLKFDQNPPADKKRTRRPKYELVFEDEEQQRMFLGYLNRLPDLYPQHDGHERRLIALMEDAVTAAEEQG